MVVGGCGSAVSEFHLQIPTMTLSIDTTVVITPQRRHICTEVGKNKVILKSELFLLVITIIATDLAGILTQKNCAVIMLDPGVPVPFTITIMHGQRIPPTTQ